MKKNYLDDVVSVMELHNRKFYKAIEKAFPNGGFAALHVAGWFENNPIMVGLFETQEEALRHCQLLHFYRHPNLALKIVPDKFETTYLKSNWSNQKLHTFWIVKKYEAWELASAVQQWDSEIVLNTTDFEDYLRF